MRFCTSRTRAILPMAPEPEPRISCSRIRDGGWRSEGRRFRWCLSQTRQESHLPAQNQPTTAPSHRNGVGTPRRYRIAKVAPELRYADFVACSIPAIRHEVCRSAWAVLRWSPPTWMALNSRPQGIGSGRPFYCSVTLKVDAKLKTSPRGSSAPAAHRRPDLGSLATAVGSGVSVRPGPGWSSHPARTPVGHHSVAITVT
jgi:hypothetical protein